jgi:hypothetical protein
MSSISPDLKPIGAFQRRKVIWDSGSASSTTSTSKKKKKKKGRTTDPAKSSYQFENFEYKDDIRILRVLAGKGDEPLRCMLFPSSLLSRVSQSKSEQHEYKALSYWWGEDEPTHAITLYDDTGVREGLENRTPTLPSGTFYVRSNLAAALKHFRREGEDINFWVDAICINQTDLLEKTAQVSMMDEIYSKAQSVCVWLGAGNPKTEETFNFLRQILDLREFDRLIRTKRTPRNWMLVINLLKNRWFSRRWVIQELVLAKSATVHWGSQVMVWSDFAEAIALFMTKLTEIQEMLRDLTSHPPYSASDDTQIRELDPRVLGANALVDATSNLFRRSADGRVQERLVNLEVLVSSHFVAFEASEPRDTIYAVLSLAQDTEFRPKLRRARSWEMKPRRPYFITSILPIIMRTFVALLRKLFPFAWAEDKPQRTKTTYFGNLDQRVAPDYDKPLVDVCADFVDYCIEKSQSLDIICRHWAPDLAASIQLETMTFERVGNMNEEEKMPSWIPSISGQAYSGPSGVLKPRTNSDSLVGSADHRKQKPYNASKGLRPYVKFGKFSDDHKQKHGSRLPTPNRTSPVGLEKKKETDPDVVEPQVPRPRKFDGTLFVKGFRLQAIEKISGRVLDGVIPKEALEFADWDGSDDNIDKVPDMLWRTLVADRGPNGLPPPAWYGRACLECLMQCNSSGDLNTKDIRNHKDTPETMRVFLERVQSVVWSRKFFLGDHEGFPPPIFGLVPKTARPGDIICILYGCSVPVVLRKIKKRDVYEFVGECYVYGMMDGEAMPFARVGVPEYPYSEKKGFTIV